MNVLVIDIGGTHGKVLATGENAEREFAVKETKGKSLEEM
jgi:sugar (pentulose or hexulose) kinase